MLPPSRTSNPALWIAWLAIAGLVAVVAGRVWLDQHTPSAAGASAALDMRARAAVGVSQLGLPGSGGSAALEQVVQPMLRAGFRERVVAALLVAESGDRDLAATRLSALGSLMAAGMFAGEYASGDLLALEVLDRHLSVPGFEPDDGAREAVGKRFGWAGRLALRPEGGADPPARAALLAQARRTALVNLVVVGLALAGVLAGLVLLVIAAIRWFGGTAKPVYEPERGRAGVFAETFAVWAVLFAALSFAAPYVVGVFDDDDASPATSLAVQLISAAAVFWPRLRGVAPRTASRRLGLVGGAGLVREALAGVVGWIALLPFMAVGVAAAALLASAGLPQPEHPIAEVVIRGDVPTLVLAVLAGCVAAPLVEELFFRGALYHHLRSALGGGRVRGALLSGLISGAVFAAIHPQGVAGLPALCAIGFGLALIREWRGSLIAPVVAHAIVNSVSFAVMIAAMR